MNTSPILTTPNLGTPTVLVGTNITGTATGLTAGNVITNANLTGPITSVGNATSVGSQTGTGATFVMSDSPALVGTPSLPTGTIAVTQGAGNNSTAIATTAYVDNISGASVNLTGPITSVGNATSIASQTGTGTTFVMDDSPALTGTPSLPTGTIAVTQAALNNTTAVATTAFVVNENLTNANLTGPITSVGNATSIASQTGTGTTFVMDASPVLTGTPSLPTGTIGVTQATGNNSTAIATTAYVENANNLTNEDTDTTNYLTFANDPTGSQPLKTNANITVNAATETIGANSFSSIVSSGTAFSMMNNTSFTAENSSSVDETFLTPRNASNETLFNYGAGGFDIRTNGGASTIYMLNSGNIGIGNKNPLGPLSFTNSLGNKIILHSHGDNVSNHYGFGIDNGLLQMYSPGDIAFGTGSSASFTERVRIKGNGNVGIGNTTPQNKLQIGPIHTDVQFVTLRSYSTGNYGENWRGGAAFGGATSTVIIGEASGVASIGGHSSTLNAWTTLAVNQGGNVNIGTSFRVHGDNATPNIRIGSAPDDIGFVNLRSYSTTGTWRGSAAFGGGSNTVIMGELAGKAYIGAHNRRLSAWAPLYINEGLYVGGTAAQPRVVIGKDPTPADGGDGGTYTYQGHLVVWGVAYRYGTATWSLASDERLKKEIIPFTGALDKISLLVGKRYKWINPKQHFNQTEEQFGFIAQEVEAIFPNWIEESDAAGSDKVLIEGKMKNISLPLEYHAYVVEAIKELKALGESRTEEIKELKAIDTIKTEAINELKVQLEALKKEVGILKNKN
jgi:hypothetical protein